MVYPDHIQNTSLDTPELLRLICSKAADRLHSVRRYITRHKSEVNRWYFELSLLHIACRSSRVVGYDVIKILLENGARVDTTDVNGNTALMVACMYTGTDSDIAIIPLLVSFGADINARNRRGQSALILSAISVEADSQTILTILSLGARIDQRSHYGLTAFTSSVVFKHNDSVARMLLLNSHGADIESENCVGESALITAAQEYDCATLNLLLDLGANIEHTDLKGNTALIWAIYGCGRLINRSKSRQAVALLLAAGANVNHMNRAGQSALIILASDNSFFRQIDVTAMLISKRVQINPPYGRTSALSMAVTKDCRLTQYLIDNGADVNHVDADGNTPVLLACAANSHYCAEILIKHGANVLHKNAAGESMLDLTQDPMYVIKYRGYLADPDSVPSEKLKNN